MSAESPKKGSADRGPAPTVHPAGQLKPGHSSPSWLPVVGSVGLMIVLIALLAASYLTGGDAPHTDTPRSPVSTPTPTGAAQ